MAIKPKYRDTKNILDLYMYCTGKSEVPPRWHLWSCLSLISAALGDRVYYKKFAWEKLIPNMYVFLVGPSGASKGGAINFAMQFEHYFMNIAYGSCTYKYLIDRMAEQKEDGPPSHCVYLVQAELANAVGSGQIADAFIKQLTDMYNPSNKNFIEGTRKSGHNELKAPPCVNWLAGTTTNWLGECVTQQALMSGFFGRVAPIYEGYRWDLRVHDPSLSEPPDYQDVIGYIYERIDELTRLEGRMNISQEAYELDREWYETRPEPSEMMAPFWRREHDLVLKLSIILSLCDSTEMMIQKKHLIKAQELIKKIHIDMPMIIRLATGTRQDENYERVVEYFKARNDVWISRKQLSIDMRKYNMRKPDIDGILDDLFSMDAIEYKKQGRGDYFKYKGMGRIFKGWSKEE